MTPVHDMSNIKIDMSIAVVARLRAAGLLPLARLVVGDIVDARRRRDERATRFQ